jgi:amino-acid N-acetyltransferase
MNSLHYRPAKPADTRGILALVGRYASQGQMLPRSYAQVMERIRDYVVAVQEDSSILGVAALHPVADDLAEIRSLAVEESWKGKGIGRQLVETCLADAKKLGIHRVFALTYQTEFFGKLRFEPVERMTLPQKIWGDCVHCAKFSDCDEVAVLRDLREP